MGKIIKNVKCLGLNTTIVSAVFNTQTLNMVLWNANVYVATGIAKKKFDEELKKRFANTCKFSNNDKLVFLLQNDVYSYENMVIGKNSKKHHYLRKKIFTVT